MLSVKPPKTKRQSTTRKIVSSTKSTVPIISQLFCFLLRYQHTRYSADTILRAIKELTQDNISYTSDTGKTYSYMMQGIPLLAVMDEGDIVSDIERGAGRWVRNGEGKLLAQHIREMKEKPDMVRRMRLTCRELYEKKYTEEICTQQYVTLFRELLGQE